MLEHLATFAVGALVLFTAALFFKLPLKSYEFSFYVTTFLVLLFVNVAVFVFAAAESTVNEYKSIRESVSEKGITVNVRQEGLWKEENFNYNN